MKKEAVTPFDRALQYLSYRSRTEAEIRIYLEKKGFDSDIVDHTLQKLEYYGYIDDEKYLQSVVQSNINGNRYGRLRLSNHLRQHGISESLLMDLDRFFTEETENDCLKVQFEKACQKYRTEPVGKQKQKINAALQRRGFSYEKIASLMRNHDFNVSLEDGFEGSLEDLKRYYQKYHRLHSKKGLEGKELKQRIFRSLLSRGYPYEEVHAFISAQTEA